MQSVSTVPLRKAKKKSLRVLLASEDRALRDRMAERLLHRFHLEARIDAIDAREAGMALLVRHPDLVVCDVALPGHVQRGFRIVSEALVLGVPMVLLCGSVQPELSKRLEQLGIAWVTRDAFEHTFFPTVDRALRIPPRTGLSRASAQ
jgi:hypothetical protein